MCSIGEMIEMVSQDPAITQDGKSAYFKVEGFVSFFPGIADGQRQAFYMACKVCKKKVLDESAGYHCEKCGKLFEEAVPSWNFSAKVNDYSNESVYLQFLGEQGSPIMGSDASEFHQMMQEGENSSILVKQALDRCYFKTWQFVIRVMLDTFMSSSQSETGPRFRYTCSRVYEYSVSK